MKRIAVIAAAAALPLAACFPSASPSPSASPASSSTAVSPSPLASASPTPSPSPTATSAGPVDPGSPPPYTSLFVHTGGIGPLEIGASAVGNPGAAMIFLIEDYCYDEDLGITTGDLDRYVPNYSPGTGLEGQDAELFSIDATGGTISRLDIWDVGMETPEGINLGDTLGELMEAYPTTLVAGTGYSPTSAVWWIEGDDGTLVFETQAPGDWTEEPDPDVEDVIILMRVLASGIDPDWAAANSGNVAGACPL